MVGSQKDVWVRVYKLSHQGLGRPNLAPKGSLGGGAGPGRGLEPGQSGGP